MLKKKTEQDQVKTPKKKKVVNKRRNNAIVGLILAVSSAGAGAWYELGGGRELLLYEDVVVAKEAIKKGQLIQEADLNFMKVEKTQLAEGVIKNPNKVIGKQANHFIPKSAQIDKSYLAENGLVLREGEFIAQIPIEWTLAIPDTLRRGDNIVMYSALYDPELLKQLQSQSVATNANNATNKPTTATTKTTTSASSNFEELLKTKVAFVKDSANREVVTVSVGERLDGSSAIGAVEIVTTLDEFNKIEAKINSGHKLIFMYTDNPFVTEENTDPSDEDMNTESTAAVSK
ncbi:hypothetical protein AWH48_16790 [Domibacillus aminovorans]|uniref:SAF domain-containing protein n=1 Tax=Domibacillus aminovorans TaxID=29332 RepID=A0A177L000_9BACI|nr:SAF domain-containing protein [Domibacillus aminovorans]OAH58654.1 hypothetical protein AWH48_16790 [Domibacillus aminovorans]